MRTYQKFSVAPSAQFSTVRIEVSMNLPQGAGLWPAFWMLPESGARDDCVGCGRYGNWPASGEIDIMEAVNNMTNVFGSVHFGGEYPANVYYSQQTPLASQVTGSNGTGFNTFGLEWSPTMMTWYLNGIPYSSAVSSSVTPRTPNSWFTTSPGAGPNAPFDVPFHLIVDLAVGGTLPNDLFFASTGTQLDVATIQQALGPDGKQMSLDFVRVCGKP